MAIFNSILPIVIQCHRLSTQIDFKEVSHGIRDPKNGPIKRSPVEAKKNKEGGFIYGWETLHQWDEIIYPIISLLSGGSLSGKLFEFPWLVNRMCGVNAIITRCQFLVYPPENKHG